MADTHDPALEDRVAATIDTCDSDPVAAVRALLVAIDLLDSEIDDLNAENARLTEAVSNGYSRGKLRVVRSGGDAG